MMVWQTVVSSISGYSERLFNYMEEIYNGKQDN